MTQSQQEAGIKSKQRITVVPLQTPKSAAAFGGASSTLPVLVFGVVLMAFVALALLFDRMFPRRREEVAPAGRYGARAGADERVTAHAPLGGGAVAYAEPAAPRRVLPIALVVGRRGVPRRHAPARGQGDARGRRRVPDRVVLAVADTAKPVFTWPNAIASLVLVIWFVPIKLYALPIELPFNLEPYRLFLLVLVFAWVIQIVLRRGRLDAGRARRPDPAPDRGRGRLDDRQLRQPERDGRRVAGQPGPLLPQLPAPVRARRLDDRPAAERRPDPPRRSSSARPSSPLFAIYEARTPVQLLRPPRRVRADPRQAGARGARAARRPAPRPRLGAAPDRAWASR